MGGLFQETPDTSTYKGRSIISKDTINRTSSIVASTPGASSSSTFYTEESCPALPLLNHEPYPTSNVEVVNSDSFTAARKILRQDPEAKVAVLNLASDEQPGGGWAYTISRTQVCKESITLMSFHRLRPMK